MGPDAKLGIAENSLTEVKVWLCILPLEKAQSSFGFLLAYSYLCTQITER